jgi:heptosyltransferase-3
MRISSVSKKSALVFRLGGLGDTLAVLPSLRLIRRSVPGLFLHLVGQPECGRLFLEARVVDGFDSAADAAWLPLFREAVDSAAESTPRISGFDFILGFFTKSPDPEFERHVFRDSNISGRTFIYDPRAGGSVSRFFFDGTADFLRAAGRRVYEFERCIRLPLKDEAIAAARRRLGLGEGRRIERVAVVHPGSGSAKKCWPLDRFFRTARFLGEKGFAGALVTGDAEERLSSAVSSWALPPRWTWLRQPPLALLAGLLCSAELYLGNDSGVTHLAAACGTRVIALFRKEFVPAWRPFGRTTVLSAEELKGIPESLVLAELRRVRKDL